MSFRTVSRSCMSLKHLLQTPFRSFLFTDLAGPREARGRTHKQTSGRYGYATKRGSRMFELRRLDIMPISIFYHPIPTYLFPISQINCCLVWINLVGDMDLFTSIIRS